MATSGDEHNISSSSTSVTKDREVKLKLVRERQNEERQRKIEDLKTQAEAAQRYREQKEEERRQRWNEIKNRDSEKRLQVEERKRAITEAEKARREYILRRNQERECRLQTQKQNRKSIGFAFGSSTPRMLEPSSRNVGYGSRYSTSTTPNTSGSRSGTISPAGIMSTSMPASAINASDTLSTIGYKLRKSVSVIRKPRPASIAGTKVSFAEINHIKKDQKPSVKCTPIKSAQTTPKRQSSSMSTSLIVTTSKISSAGKNSTLKSSTPKQLTKASSCGRLNKSTPIRKSASEISTSGFSSDVVDRKRKSEVPAKSKPAKNDATTSPTIPKQRIQTEEEAKAALSERRRRVREELQRQAELERQRLEAESLAEVKRQEEETERQRQLEEETTRLANEQRMAEEERLRRAIEEARRRDEEEQRMRDEEEQQRVAREETEKRAQEEAERESLQMAECLAEEIREREERRKRVQAIMSRSRKSGVANVAKSTSMKEIESIPY